MTFDVALLAHVTTLINENKYFKYKYESLLIPWLIQVRGIQDVDV